MYSSTYVAFVHPDEMAAARFVAGNVRQQISVVVDEAFAISFYAKEIIPMLVVDKGIPSDVAKMKFENRNMSLQYLPRQRYYYNLGFSEGNNSLVYSNGLSRIYHKPSSNSR
jgi:hypothetical protein